MDPYKGNMAADASTIVSSLLPIIDQGHSTGARLLNPPARPQGLNNPSPFYNTPQASELQQAMQVDPFAGCERYVRGRFLGKGASGQVYSAWDTKEQTHVAIKFLDAPSVYSRYLEREILNHRGLHHPHVIKFKEVIATQTHIGIVMELANHGTLHEYVQRVASTGVPETIARWMFQQLVLAVDYCHQKGIANRDLKLGNVLLDMPQDRALPVPVVKLCDFGYSKSDTQSAARSRVGTIFYMAPEVLNCTAEDTYNSKMADVWSCGVILYRMLYNQWPFAQNNTKETVKQITRLEYVIPASPPVSDDCKRLLVCMLAPKDQRITLQAVQQHPWFQTGVVEDIVAWNQAVINAPVNEAELQPLQQILSILETASNQPPAVGNVEDYDRMYMMAEREELQRSLDLDLPSLIFN